jgi:hypothetical protein
VIPRGLRNRNPGNIRRSGIDWRGLSPEQPDPEFCTFESDVFGLRAMARILLNYQRRHRLMTLRSILQRWAPPAENDTNAYVDHVASQIGVAADAWLDLEDVAMLTKLITAMVRHENNGQQPYTIPLIRDAVAMAQDKATA